MQIIVASKNPVKIAAARSALEQAFPHKTLEVQGISVPSGVSDQPMTDEETYRGAKQRVLNAQAAHSEGDMWIGMEGGVEMKNGYLHAFAWMYVLSRGQTGEARTASFTLPPAVAKLVQQGVELGVADDQVFGTQNSKHHQGAVGLLTNNIITRETLYSPALVMALIPFLQGELYEKGE